MKKIFSLGIILVVVCLIASTLARTVSQLTRGQMRLNLSKELAIYLEENEYRFPENWAEYEKFHGKKSNGVYKQQTNSYLDNKFSLPWDERLTDSNVLSSVWFKGLGRERLAEDRVFTREVLFSIWEISTNRAAIENVITIWDNNQQDVAK